MLFFLRDAGDRRAALKEKVSYRKAIRERKKPAGKEPGRSRRTDGKCGQSGKKTARETGIKFREGSRIWLYRLSKALQAG
jgi:hypothetical protein